MWRFWRFFRTRTETTQGSLGTITFVGGPLDGRHAYAYADLERQEIMETSTGKIHLYERRDDKFIYRQTANWAKEGF